MRTCMRSVAALAVVVLFSAFVLADDAGKKTSEKAPETKGEAKAASQAEARPVRLTKPWRELNSLTEDQKRQINQIHRKAAADVKAIEQREHDDIMALLSEPQKTELKAMEEKEKAEKKAKGGDKPKAGTSTKTSLKNADSDRADATSEADQAAADAVN